MKFSQIDVIGQERFILFTRKQTKGLSLWTKIMNSYHNPRNPTHTFSFYVPHYLYIRSVSFCDDVAEMIDKDFTTNHLAKILYVDFLSYFKRKNDLHDIYSRLTVRDLSPAAIKPYQNEEATKGILFEEVRGFELIETHLEHRLALKGEFLLRDMMEIYQDHTFTLENILEIVYCDFVEDYRKGLIKNPINKIVQYIG
ncbi:hypothetical protein KHA93_11530 [Bacillus sp. FJAT-49732]|uniref:Uncharacterized protein n=1 Tax=Lederbergia citrisecunda TaxID=2833583 RepID=A0A942TL78_9BACI|nr:hypothetical protein [Lederbergia citrisecunda]MBS4200261.1 hypothetical protein [Lederbergia citrisecunda]